MPVVQFSELDNLLNYFDEGYKTSHDEAYRRFSESNLSPPDDLPSDPFSEAYAARYLDLYKKISSRAAYSSQNELSNFNVDQVTYRPFPYFTRSLKLAGQHFTLIGKLLEIMDFKEGSSILELTMSLALCLPTTAYPKGAHGRESNASGSHVTHRSFHTVA